MNWIPKKMIKCINFIHFLVWILSFGLILTSFSTIAYSEKTKKITSKLKNENRILVTLLGTGGGPGGGGPNLITKNMNANTLVEAGGEKFLFDAGRGAFLRLASISRKHLIQTNKVFLTHLHSDHIIDLSDLFLNGSGRGLRQKFFVSGPSGTENLVNHLVKAYKWDLSYRSNPRRKKLEMIGRDITEGIVYDNNNIKITAFNVDHWPPRKKESDRDQWPSLGYRLDFKNYSVVISGDTRPSANLIKFSKGVDVLIHEVHVALNRNSFSNRRVIRGAHHTSPTEAGKIFSKVKPRLAIFSHIVWGLKSKEDLIKLTRRTYDGRFLVGQEMMQISIGDNISVKKPN